MMVAAGKEMAQFVGEKNRQEGGREGQASEKACGILVEESEGAKKLVNGSSLIVGVGDGELRARGQAGAERHEKQGDS